MANGNWQLVFGVDEMDGMDALDKHRKGTGTLAEMEGRGELDCANRSQGRQERIGLVSERASEIA